jgi:hypothetical protein
VVALQPPSVFRQLRHMFSNCPSSILCCPLSRVHTVGNQKNTAVQRQRPTANLNNPGAATGWWNWSELDSKCLDWCIDDHYIVYNVWTNSTELLEAVKSLPSMWLPTHCGSLLFAEHSPGLKDPMHNRNSLVEGNQVIRYWYHYYTSLCNALQSSRYCWRSYHRIKHCLESFEAVIANPVHCGGCTKNTKHTSTELHTFYLL